MKHFYLLAIACTLSSIALCQNKTINVSGDYITGDKVDKKYETFYKTIKITNVYEERELLFLAMDLSAYRLDSTKSKSFRDRCDSLYGLCTASFNDKVFYTKNKAAIRSQVTTLFDLQNKQFREQLETKARSDYRAQQLAELEENIAILKRTDNEDSLSVALDFLTNQLQVAPVEFGSIKDSLIKQKAADISRGAITALPNARSPLIIDKLFLLFETIGNKSENNISSLVASINSHEQTALRQAKEALGHLLLEGYKLYFKQHKQLKRDLKFEDIVSIYFYVTSISDSSTLQRNILLAQVSLSEKGLLNCSDKNIANGYGWADKPKYIFRVPAETYLPDAQTTINLSPLNDSIVPPGASLPDKWGSTVKAFNYQLRSFRQLVQHLNTPFIDVSSLIYNNELLLDWPIAHYSNCYLYKPLAEHIYARFYPLGSSR